MKKLYFLLTALLISFVASAETLTISYLKYVDGGDNDEYSETSEIEATINGYAVTIDNFLGSGKSITFKCYDDETVYHNWDKGYTDGSFTFGEFGTYTQIYVYGNSDEAAYYVEDEDGKYIELYVYADGDYMYIYIDLPDDFTPGKLYTYSGTANVTAYSLVDGVETGDAIAETLGISISDTTLSITNAFGNAKLASYLSFDINEDGSVTGPNPGYFTSSYTFNGTSYKRLYDNTYKYDIDTNTFIWGISLSAAGNGSDNVDYSVHIPLPDDFSAAVKDITVDSAAVDGPVEYFNLQGIRVANPENGLYIRRQGNTATKVLIK
jgi:hypothetical protein